MSQLTVRGEFALFSENQHTPEIPFADFIRIYSATRLHPALQSEVVSTSPVISAGTDDEKVWLVAATAAGEWVGMEGWLAIALDGIWHFRQPVEGLYYNLATHTWRTFDDTTWADAGV